MAKVLCIDDDETVARLIAEVVEFCGHTSVIETNSIEAATTHLRDSQIAAVLTDFMMPALDGIDLLTIWQEQRPQVRRVLITAAPNEAPVKAAGRSGLAQMVIAKPPSIADVKLAVAWLAQD